MERAIFCPDETKLQEAEILAKKYNLPIIIGLNKHIKNLDFNKTLTQVLSIPKKFEFFIYKQKIQIGFNQCIIFTDDFNIIKNKIKIFNNNEEVPILWQEQHRLKSAFPVKKEGINEVKVLFNGKVVGHGEYEVYRKN